MSQYVQVGIFLITVPNLIVTGLMVVVFALAIALKLPLAHRVPDSNDPGTK
jgi:hypothetical protein